MREVVISLMDAAAQNDSLLELEERLDLGARFLDSACFEFDIHHPANWALLRDTVRTLMKATVLVRKRNLKVRVKVPEVVLKRMNRLSILRKLQFVAPVFGVDSAFRAFAGAAHTLDWG